MLSIKSAPEMADELAQRLKTLRLQHAWSREELGWRAGVNPTTLKRFELTGQISLERLLKLSIALGVEDDFETVLKLRQAKSMKEIKQQIKKRQRGRTSK